MKPTSHTAHFSKFAAVTALTCIFAGSTSAAAPVLKSKLRGAVILPVTELSERIGEIEVPSQGKMQKTGKIELTLDPNAKRPQQMILDFDKMRVTIQTNQLLNADLLASHGLQPIRMNIDESGEFQLLGLTHDRRTRTASATLSMRVGANVPFDSEPFKGGLAKNYKVDKCSYPANKCRRIALSLDGAGNVCLSLLIKVATKRSLQSTAASLYSLMSPYRLKESAYCALGIRCLGETKLDKHTRFAETIRQGAR